MSLSSWRQFQFYENIPIKDPQVGTNSPLYANPTLSAAALIDKSTFALAIDSNVIRTISLTESKPLHEFKAFEDDYRISYLHVINDTFLVAIAECVAKQSLIRIYRLDNLPTKEDSYHSQVEVKNGNNTFPISDVSISNDLTCIVVGFVNGKLILIRGDLSRDRGSQQRIIYQDIDKEAITCSALSQNALTCFVATTSRILLFNTTGRNKGKPDIILSSQRGLNLNCGQYNKATDEFICCFDDSVEFYRENGDKRILLFDLPSKKRIFPMDKDHILLVVEEPHSHSTALDFNELSSSIINRIIIIDIKNKIIALNFLVASNIIDIFSTKDGKSEITFFLTSDGSFYKITEKSLEAQLDIVIQKELFSFALQLAQQNALPSLEIEEIHKKYGDFLFKKGERKEATNQYTQCLNVVESSEVISKFGQKEISDSEDIQILLNYLWALVKNGVANPDHITLLLIILIKLKDTDQIEFFILHFDRIGKFNKNVVRGDIDDETFFYSDINLFDLDLIVNLLQQSNYQLLSYKLAKKFSKDSVIVVEILLELLNNPSATLDYIRSLSVEETLRCIVAFSKQLLEKMPNKTNVLLIELFTGKYKPSTFTNETDYEIPSKDVAESVKTVFYSYTTFFKHMTPHASSTASNENNSMKPKSPTYQPPKPSIIFSSFVSKPFEFVVFLEACLESYQRYEGFDEDKQIILTTLYDLYLSLSSDDISERRADWNMKAIKVLKESNNLITSYESNYPEQPLRKGQLDNSLTLLISHMNKTNFITTEDKDEVENTRISLDSTDDNLLNMYRAMLFTEEPLSCFKFLEKYGEKEPQLYCVALSYFAQSNHNLKEIGGEEVMKEKIIKPIGDNHLMSILELIQILSSTNVATFGLIQDLLIDYVKEEDNEITKTQKLIESYQAELKEKSDKLEVLLDSTEPSQVSIKNQACFMCNTSLDLPVVFFKCGHIYHQRCLNGETRTASDGEEVFKCPKCMIALEASNKLYEAQHEIGQNADLLNMTLNNETEHEDRFKVITDFIARGALQ